MSRLTPVSSEMTLPFNFSFPLFFCGLKHCGKSTMGRMLAETYDLEFFDADDLILESIDRSFDMAGTSIREFYRTYGQEAFQSLEYSSLSSHLQSRCQDLPAPQPLPQMLVPAIYALGGGACDNLQLVNLIRVSGGSSCYIRQDETVLLKRILRNGIPPFLNKKKPEESFHDIFVSRDVKYRAFCDYTVDVSGERPIVETAAMLDRLLRSLDVRQKEDSLK